MTTHVYVAQVRWQGSTGVGYRQYSRAHQVTASPADGVLDLSADPHFGGDMRFLNPEQLLVMAAGSCQLLSFLALAARRRVDIVGYEDNARALMSDDARPVRIERIELSPVIHVMRGTDHDSVQALVQLAHEECYVANSLTSSVVIDARVMDA
jgi:organic hydroperoxide reductase OsmC/OhrA